MSFVSRHRAGVRATTPVEQVRGGARKSGSSAVVLRQGGDLAQVGTFYSPQKGPGNCTRPLPSASKAETGRAAVLSVFLMNLAARPLRQLLTVTVGGGIAALSVSYDSCKRPEEPRRYRRVPRCIARRRAWVVSSPRAAPRRDKFGGLSDMSSTLDQVSSRSS